MFPVLHSSSVDQANDTIAYKGNSIFLDNEKENGTDFFSNNENVAKAVERRISRKKTLRSKYSLTEIGNVTDEFSGGGVLGKLAAPTSTRYIGKKNANRSRIRQKGTEDVKLPPIESLRLSNYDSNRKNNSFCPKVSPQFLCNTKQRNTAAITEPYAGAEDTLSSSTNRSLLSPEPKSRNIDDSSCQTFHLGRIPSKIMNSPCSIVSKLGTPCVRKSVSSPYLTGKSYSDGNESVEDDDSLNRAESVSVIEVNDGRISTPESTTSSEISIPIPRNKKTIRRVKDNSIATDDSDYEEWEDEDTDYSSIANKENYDDNSYGEECDSKADVVDESFFGQTIVAKLDRNFSPTNTRSTKGYNEHCTESDLTDYANDCSLDTEIELSEDESYRKFDKNPVAKYESHLHQMINITSTTASLTISSGRDDKDVSRNSSIQRCDLSNEENSVSAVVVLDESTIYDIVVDQVEVIESPNKITDELKLKDMVASFHVSKSITTTCQESIEENIDEEKSNNYCVLPKKNLRRNQTFKRPSESTISSKLSIKQASLNKLENARDLKNKHNENLKSGLLKKGKWTLGPKIGVGTFGVVHMGMNTLTGKLMAVKKICIPGSSSSSSNNNTLQDLHSEVELMRSLDHVNIVRYLGAEVNKKKNIIFIFQEWIPGGSVASLLHKFGPFPIPVVKTYLRQILTGLHYLHSCRILHRDIKGGNILINDHGVVKLADFGASKRISKNRSGEEFENVTENMIVKGTPYFMAPEVFEEMCGPKADIWSVGGVVIQMITGDPPWKSMDFRSPLSLFYHLKKTDGPPPLKLPPQIYCDNDSNTETCDKFESLQDLIGKCFCRDPKNRPSVTELLIHPCLTNMNASDSVSDFSGSPNKNSILSCSPDPKQLSENFQIDSPQQNIVSGACCVDGKLISSPIKSPVFISGNWPNWAMR